MRYDLCVCGCVCVYINVVRCQRVNIVLNGVN